MKSSKKNKFYALTLLELMLAIFLVSLVFAPLGKFSYQYLRKWQYEKDLSRLRSDLQLAYDMVLHCDASIRALFKESKNGLTLSLTSNNKTLDKSLFKERLYPRIKKMTLNRQYKKRLRLTFSESGDFVKPEELYLYGPCNQKNKITLKGYPHVLEIE